MRAKINCESFTHSLETIISVTGAEHAVLEIRGNDMYISGVANSKACRMHVIADVEAVDKKHNSFGFNCFTVQKLLNGREEIVFEFNHKEAEVRFHTTSKKSKFSGNFQTLPPEDIEVIFEDGAQKLSLDAKQLASLNAIVPVISLNNMSNADPMLLCASFNKDGLFATVFDDYHSAYAHNPAASSKTSIDFNIPLNLFQQISKVANGQSYTLSVGLAYISAKGVGFELSLPIIQGQSSRQLNQMRAHVESLKWNSMKDRLPINKTELAQILGNLEAVNDGTATFDLSCNGKGSVTISIKSPFGSAEERRKIKGQSWSSEYKLTPPMFKDVFSAYAGKEIELIFSKGVVYMIHEQGSVRVVYSCILVA